MKPFVYFFVFVTILGCGGKGLEPTSNPQTNNNAGPQTSAIIPIIQTFSVNDSANPGTVPYSKAVTLKWTTANAATCSVSSPSNPALGSGTSSVGVNTGLITAGTTFTITCTSKDGIARSLSIAVTVPAGQWINASGQNCQTFCAASPRLLTNAPSPEGMYCTSNENPISAANANATSVDDECYRIYSNPALDQKQDGDASDRTNSCFCR